MFVKEVVTKTFEGKTNQNGGAIFLPEEVEVL